MLASATARTILASAGIVIAAATAGCTAPPPEPVVVTLTPTVVPVAPDPTTAPTATPSASPSPTPSATPSPEPTIFGPITNPPAGQAVVPEVSLATVDTDAMVLVVRADVPGIVEDGGTCSVSVTVSATVVKKSNIAAGNVTTTECGQYLFPLSSLPKGRAFVTVYYSSPTHSGKSLPTEVSLP